MALEMVKSNLQPASWVTGNSYGIGHMHAEAPQSSSENCDPNVVKDVRTPVKLHIPKSPAKSKKPISNENDMGKSPSRRKLDCDGGLHENGMIGKSPGKSSISKETGTPTRKHFCRSPRCAANDPDYAIPVPRTYLKSKRHLIPGWVPPVNSKCKVPVSPMRRQGDSSSFTATNGGPAQAHDNGVLAEPSIGDLRCADGGDVEHIEAKTHDEASDLNISTFKVQVDAPVESISPCRQLQFGTNTEELDLQCKESRSENESEMPTPSSSLLEDLGQETNTNTVEENRGDDETMISTSSVSTCEDVETEAVAGVSNMEVLNNPTLLDVVATNEGRHSDSDFSMLSTGGMGSDGGGNIRSSLVPLQPALKFHRMGRRLSVESSGLASKNSVALKSQAAMKRKQAEDWMWDAAIKEAVSRLDPQGDRGVNILVRAFESVVLTDEEMKASQYKNTASGQSGLPGTYHQDGYVDGDMFHVEKMSSINKVRAWNESMAASGLHTHCAEHLDLGSRASRASQELHDCNASDSTESEQNGENIGSPSEAMQQGGFLQSSSNSEPSKLGNSRWANASNASLNIKDDLYSEKETSSPSGKSGFTEWTCERKSQAAYRRKHRLKRYTSLHPFRLRTEERGAMKEYEFSKRLQQLWAEEQRLRIPIAQGLPWTTDEPEVPPKPPAKEQTKAEGFRLLTDMRAVVRAEYDNYIAERNLQMELQKQEEERQRQIVAEEEVRRLRREMVPRAQLMPYFDRPFMPRRSSKRLTVPKEPSFHLKQNNKRAKCIASCHINTA